MRHHWLYRALRDMFRALGAKDITIYAGYAAYTDLLAFFPFIIFLVALSGFLGDTTLADTIIARSFELFPREIAETLTPIIRQIMESEDSAILTFSALGTLWVASSGVEGLRFGLNQVHEVDERRALWKRRLQGIAFVLLMSVAFLAVAILIIAWPLVVDLVHYLFPWIESLLVSLLRFAMVFLLLVTAFTIIYRVLPNSEYTWRHLWPGAMIAALLWLLLAGLFSFYLLHFGSYDARYGSLAGIIITMLFFHFSNMVIMLGAAYNVALLRQSRP